MEWDHESSDFRSWTKKKKDLDSACEIRQQSEKLCRLRSHRRSNKNESVCLSVCSLCVLSEDAVCSPAVTHSVWGDLGLNQQYVWPSSYKHWTQRGSACLAYSPLVTTLCSWSAALIYTPKHTHIYMPVCARSGGAAWVMQWSFTAV